MTAQTICGVDFTGIGGFPRNCFPICSSQFIPGVISRRWWESVNTMQTPPADNSWNILAGSDRIIWQRGNPSLRTSFVQCFEFRAPARKRSCANALLVGSFCNHLILYRYSSLFFQETKKEVCPVGMSTPEQKSWAILKEQLLSRRILGTDSSSNPTFPDELQKPNPNPPLWFMRHIVRHHIWRVHHVNQRQFQSIRNYQHTYSFSNVRRCFTRASAGRLFVRPSAL